MKIFALPLLLGIYALGAEPTVEQQQERYEHGAASCVDVLKAQEDALLKELIDCPLPLIEVEGDNPLEAYMQILMAQGEATQQDVQKAQEDWLRLLQMGVVLRGLQPCDKLTALQKNLQEQQQLAQKKVDAGVGNKLELLIAKAKLAAWFNTH